MTIMANAPRKSRKKLSQAQLNMQHRFRMASCWAMQILKDPAELAKYKAKAAGKNKSPYNLAMADFLAEARESGMRDKS